MRVSFADQEQRQNIDEALRIIFDRLATLERKVGATDSNDAPSSSYFCSTALTTIHSSTAETEVVACTVPGRMLRTDGAVKLEFWFTYYNNSGGAANLTLRVKFGGTTLATFGAVSMAASANRYAGKIEVVLKNTGSAVAQEALCRFMLGENIAGTGVNAEEWWRWLTTAIDTTVAQDLQITVQHGTSSGLIIFYHTLTTMHAFAPS